jgi:hypothetical protein
MAMAGKEAERERPNLAERRDQQRRVISKKMNENVYMILIIRLRMATISMAFPPGGSLRPRPSG